MDEEIPVGTVTALPLVSCLMVTQQARAAVAPRAVRAFNRQTYPHRELVIVSVDDAASLTALVRSPGRVRFIRAPRSATLGDLRNLAVDRAAGAFVAMWDDDDWCHPRRLDRQLMALRASDAQACLLARCTFVHEARQEFVVVHAWPHTCYATIVAHRAAMPRYPPLPRGEDHVIRSLHVVTVDEPGLYVRTLHGANTCDVDHARELMHRLTSYRLPAAAIALLKAEMDR
jgi:glycosyltransferase involved in cell wall biosynthesis